MQLLADASDLKQLSRPSVGVELIDLSVKCHVEECMRLQAMFRAVYCAPILGVIPSHDFVFRSYRKTELGDPITLTLVPNRNPDGNLAYGAPHTVIDDAIKVTQEFATCDSELYIEGTTFRYFDRELFHSLMFLLTIRSRNSIYAPVFCTRSVLTGEVNEWIGDSVQPLVDSAIGSATEPKVLGKGDKAWIQRNWTSCIRMAKDERFQSSMQALNSFLNIPSINFNFFASCTGLEAVFRISGFAKKAALADAIGLLLKSEEISKEVREMYRLRNKVAHGEHRESGVTAKDSLRAFELLCMCLERVLEDRSFPTP